MDHTRDITIELFKAMAHLGGDPETLMELGDDLATKAYKLFEDQGAKSDLLGIVGSWGDTQDDDWVLDSLRWWNDRRARGLG